MSKNVMKGFKVTNANRTRTCGIASTSLSMLLQKACEKFQVKEKGSQLCMQDGTVVDDDEYFSTLPAQTCFVLVQKGQHFLTGADIIYNALRAVNVNTLETGVAAKQFLDESIRNKLTALTRLINEQDHVQRDQSHLSTRSEDPAWFQGLDTGAKTKEAFMRRRCGERMRGYLYKAERDIKSHPSYSEIQSCADSALIDLKRRLSDNMHMGYYFDRSCDGALCELNGRFNCDGLWNKTECESTSGHKINPYSSREQRIIFSTWNLDHRIEKSREVIPSLIKACLKSTRQPDRFDINTPYFYSLLFTRNNLRLVHIVCHDKGAHTTAKCDPKLITIDKGDEQTQTHGIKRKLALIDDELPHSTEVLS